MQKDKYQQNICFLGFFGALSGVVDGVVVNFIYYNQLQSFFLKVVYIIYSINFHAVLGVIAGVLTGIIPTIPRLESLRMKFAKFIVFVFVFAYFSFYTNLLLWNFNQEFFNYFVSFPSLINQIILLPLAFLITVFILRLYNKIPEPTWLKGRKSLLVLLGAVLVNVVIGFFLGRGGKGVEVHVADIRQVSVGDRLKYNSPPGFIPPENLLIIVVDTLRADHLGCYGYPKNTSPFIDRFSREGVLFQSAIVQKPRTSPSIASLFTSLYVQDHGVANVNTRLPDKYFTLAESYLKHNFLTQSFVANATVSADFNFDQGFMDCTLAGDEVIYTRAAKWLEKNKGKPFFLYLHLIAPHIPYDPPREFDIFPPDMKNSSIIDSGSLHKRAYLDGHSELNYYISKYDGEIRYADHLIEKIIKKLERLDLKKNTLIILTSDHGESLGEHGYFFRHGLFPYDASARVPFILYYEKGNFPVKKVRQAIELIDVFPTVHEMMGLTYNVGDIKGRSFLPLLFGGDYSDKAFLESGDFSKVSRFYAIRDERWKLIYNSWLPSAGQLFSFGYLSDMYRKQWLAAYALLYPQRDIYELYDLQKDPRETQNLYRPDSEIASLLIRELSDKIDEKGRKYIARVPPGDLSQRIKGHLKALGYL